MALAAEGRQVLAPTDVGVSGGSGVGVERGEEVEEAREEEVFNGE